MSRSFSLFLLCLFMICAGAVPSRAQQAAAVLNQIPPALEPAKR